MINFLDLRFYMLAKAFMLGSKNILKPLNFQAHNLLLRNKHDFLKISLGGGRKTFDCASPNDLLMIQKFFGVTS